MPSEKRFGRIAATSQTESRRVSHERKTLYHLLILAVFGSGCHRRFSTFAFPVIGTTLKIARRLGSDDSFHTPTVSSLPFLTRRTTTRLPPDQCSMSLLAPSASIRIEEGVVDDDETKKMEGVIFDIDGTLADSWKLGYDATLLILSQNSIPSITQETYHRCTRYSTPDRLARHAGLHPDDHDRFVRVGETLARQFDDLYVRLVTVDTAGFYPGISDLIHDQIPRSIPMGALTNACVDYARAVLRVNNNRPPQQLDDDANTNNTTDRMSLVDRFVTVHGADSVPRPKPSPDGLLQCCHEMNLRPDQCVYIGDSPSDAAAAKAAGMKMAIGVSWGSHSEESLTSCGEFDILCSTVDELSQFLSRELNRSMDG